MERHLRLICWEIMSGGRPLLGYNIYEHLWNKLTCGQDRRQLRVIELKREVFIYFQTGNIVI